MWSFRESTGLEIKRLCVIGRGMVFEAMSLGEIIEGVNVDRKDKRPTILSSR